MKWIIRLVIVLLIFLITNLIGYFLWPLGAYLTKLDIRNLCLSVSAIIAIIGIILIAISFLKFNTRKIGSYILIIACACSSCDIFTLYNRFGSEGAHYVGDYVVSRNGLVDKYGLCFIKIDGDCYYKVFDKQLKKDVYLVIKSEYMRDKYSDGQIDTMITDNPYVPNDTINTTNPINKFDQFKCIEINKFDETGKRIDFIKLDKMCCSNIKEYIENHIGKIIVCYGDCDWYLQNTNYYCIKSNHGEVLSNESETNEEQSNSELEEDDLSDTNSDQEENIIDDTHNVSNRQDYTPQYETRDEWVNCWDCNGTGKCRYCHGDGTCVSTWSDGSYNSTYQCGVCYGSGRCQQCYGNRGHYEKRTYQVR